MSAYIPRHYREKVVSLLSEVYTNEGVQIWMNSPNRHLGLSVPADLINDGDGELVLAEAERLAAL